MQENEFKIGSLLRAKTKEELLDDIFGNYMSMPELKRDLQLLHVYLEEEEQRLTYHKGIPFTMFVEPSIEYNEKDRRGVIPFGFEGLILLENKNFYQGKIPHCKVLFGEIITWLPANSFVSL